MLAKSVFRNRWAGGGGWDGGWEEWQGVGEPGHRAGGRLGADPREGEHGAPRHAGAGQGHVRSAARHSANLVVWFVWSWRNVCQILTDSRDRWLNFVEHFAHTL